MDGTSATHSNSHLSETTATRAVLPKMRATDFLNLLVCCTGFISTFVTVYDLFHFLSYFDIQQTERKAENSELLEKCSSIQSALFSNAALLFLFMVQHSLMATRAVKNVLKTLHLSTVERSLYLIFTSGALQTMMRLWTAIPEVHLWAVQSKILEWLVGAAHMYAWTVIYMGSISMDLTELLGVKQVYYDMNGFAEPLTFKSKQLRRLYLHMRHPSFISFSIILLVCPVMSADRLLLAAIWIAYMAARWKIDTEDYKYTKHQFERKYEYFLKKASPM